MKPVIINGKEWTKQKVKDLILENDKAVYRAILRIYSFQTLEEQYSEETKEHNGQGFSGIDAKFLSSLAKQIQEGRKLSPKQLEKARNRMIHYVGQIYNYMKTNQD